MKRLYFIFLILLSLTAFSQSKIILNGGNPRALFGGAGGIGYNASTGVSTAISVQNIANLGTLATSLLPDSAIVTVGGYYSQNDGGGGYFVWNHLSSATPVQGMIVAGLGGTGRWFRQWDGYHLNLLWFGAVGDGATDCTAAEQSAFNFQANAQVYVPSPAVSYITKNNVYLNTSGVYILGQNKYGTQFVEPIGNTYGGAHAYRTMWMLGNIVSNGGVKNITIENVNLLNQDTVTTLNGASIQPNCILGFQDSGFVALTGMADSNINILNCVISAPNGKGAGIFLDAYRNNFGGVLRYVTIKGCDFINIAGAALQLLNTNVFGDRHMSDFYVGYNRFSNCGNGYTANGFGVSIGGFAVRGNIEFNNGHHIAGIFLECGGPSSTTMAYNTLDSSYQTVASGLECDPFTFNNINGNGGGPGYGNKMIGNKVLDSVYNNFEIFNQVNFECSGNIIHMVNTSNSGSFTGGVGSVSNSSFSNDIWTMTGSESNEAAFDVFNYGGTGPASGNGICKNVTFTNEIIIGATGDQGLIRLRDSCSQVVFKNITFGTHPSTIVYTDGTNSNCTVEGIDAVNLTTFNWGTPASISPSGLITQETDSSKKQILFTGTTTTYLNGAGVFTTPGGGGFANPMTTVGDMIVGGTAGAATRIAAGTSTYVLTSNGAGVAPTWQVAPGAGGGVTSVGTFSASSQTNGASISSSVITFGPADATNPGMVTTGAQTLAGAKTFNAAIVNSSTIQGTTLTATTGMASNAYKGYTSTTYFGSSATGNGVNFQRGSTTDFGIYPTTGNVFIAPNGATNADKSVSLNLVGSMAVQTSIQSGTTYTILGTDYVVIFTGTSGATWTFPTGSAGRMIALVNQGTASITLGTAVTTANGTTTTTLAAGSNLQIVYDATNTVWRKIN